MYILDGIPECHRKLRLAGETLEKVYPLSYGLSFESKVASIAE